MRVNILILLVAVLVSSAAFCGFGFGKVAFADGADVKEVPADIVAPSTYLEYCKLNAPIDVAVDENRFVIAEIGKIIKYENGLFTYFDTTGYSISKIALYGDYCLFLSVSKIYYMHLDTGAITETDISVSNYFFVYGNTLVTNPSSSVFRYTLSIDGEGKLNFGSKTTFTDLDAEARKITVLNGDSIYYLNEGKLYPFDFSTGTGERIVENIGDIRYTATDGETLYYSSASGIYKIDLYAKTVSRIISCVNEEKLFNIINPQGVYFFKDCLYVADAVMNTVYQIDLSSGKTTDFAVTDRGDADNRIETAVDIAADENCVYTLEPTDIKVYDRRTGKYYSYSLNGLPGAKHIAATEKYLFLSDSSNPYVAKKDGKQLSAVGLNSDVSDYKNIVDVNARENCFYFVNNESINSTMTACVYKLDTETMTISLVTRFIGTGTQLTSDIFGTFYIAVYDNTDYDYYSFNPEHPDIVTTMFSTDTKPYAFFSDIESNIFILFDNEVIDRFSDGGDGYEKAASYHVSLSENLPDHLSVSDVCLIDGTDELYLLTESCLLKTIKDCPLSDEIIALSQLPVPEDYEIGLETSPKFVTVDKGAKLFIVELPELNDFKRTDRRYYESKAFRSEASDDRYIVLAETLRYYLVFNMNTCAVVRKTDVAPYSPEQSDVNAQYYVVDDYGTYGYPVTDAYFKIGGVSVNEKVTAVKKIKFNDVVYVYIDYDGGSGFVPETLLKKSVSADNTPSSYYTIKIKKGGATVYAEKELSTEIGRLNGEAELFAVSDTDGVTKIYYGDGVGYIKTEDVVPSTFYSVRNIIVISALFIGLMATVIYLLVVKVFNRKEHQ